jgi:serine/threonine protein kinase
VFSAGCVLYELAALRPPFRGTNLTDLGNRICQGAYPALPVAYSRSLATVIAAMLTVDPRRRPTAAAVLALPEMASARADPAVVALLTAAVRGSGGGGRSPQGLVTTVCHAPPSMDAHAQPLPPPSPLPPHRWSHRAPRRCTLRPLRRCWAPSPCPVAWAGRA